MNSTSCTTPSRLALATGLACLLCGCAASVPAQRAIDQPQIARPVVEPAAAAAPAPVLTLEYGNRSTKATFQVDLSGSDVHVELSGRALRTDSVRTAPVARAVTETVAKVEDPVLPRARMLADSALRQNGAASDSTTAKVVAAIRKAQECFYQGRYAEASDLARAAISIRPTAEAHALAGSISWVRKEREDARLHWLRARDLDPTFPGLASVLDSLPAVEIRR